MGKTEHFSASQIERQKEKLARRERREKTWNIVILVIAIIFILTVLAIQISHHI